MRLPNFVRAAIFSWLAALGIAANCFGQGSGEAAPKLLADRCERLSGEVLGAHHERVGQWGKAFEVYSQWQPRSLCGTCAMSMRRSRANHLLLCRIHLGQAAEVVDACWKELARGCDDPERLTEFLLVRLYAEAGQLDDLRLLSRQLVKAGPRQYTSKVEGYTESRKAIANASAALLAGCEQAARKEIADHFAVIDDPREESPWKILVAYWQVVELAPLEELKQRAAQESGQVGNFLELLAARDTTAAREALIEIALHADSDHKRLICGLIRTRLANPEPLIARIAAPLAGNQNSYISATARAAPVEFEFVKAWTPPRPGSLPKRLPADLFEASAER